MTKQYDVIVIGAGLGGLSAATTMAHEGLDVLLLERHNVPGGYATSFVRSRAAGGQPYEFEVALHALSGVGPPQDRGNVYRVLEHLGVADKVEFLHLPNLYRAVFLDPSGSSGRDPSGSSGRDPSSPLGQAPSSSSGQAPSSSSGQAPSSSSGQALDITLPVGREAFEAKLAEVFPHEAAGIHRFMTRVFDFGREYARFLRQRRQVHPLAIPFRFPHFVRYLPTTWERVLNRDVKDPRARAVLSQYWGYVGLPPSKVSFIYLASTLAAFVRRGAVFPKGRSQALSSAFLTTFEELGGEARLNCGVQHITTANGRVTGVITEDGEEIRANWIVSNADPITTCRDLIGASKIPASFFTRLQSSELGASTVVVYLGVACPPEDLGLTEYEILINADYDFDRHYEATRTIEAPDAVAMACYNLVYPSISPPGTSMIVLATLAKGEVWSQLPPAEYVDTKNRIAGAMIDMAEQVAPGLRQHAEVVEVSTPLTNMRYAGTLSGSIYGFNQPPRDNMVWRMGYKGPLDGLYFAGAWTQPGGGFEPTLMSGVRAGRSISFKAKKGREEAPHGS